MASTYQTPGVYIEEISTFPPSIASVETAIPAFIGYTEIAEKDGVSLINKPTRLTSLLEYEQYFGGPEAEANISADIQDVVDGATFISRTITAASGATSKHTMYYNLQMYFKNGGGPCYIVSVGDYTSAAIAKPDLSAGLATVAKEDEVTIIVFPEGININTANNYHTLLGEALTQCKDLQDRVVVGDVFTNSGNTVKDNADEFRTISLDLEQAKYGAVYYPTLDTLLNYYYDDVDVTLNHDVTDIDTNTTANGSFDGDTLDTLETTETELYNQVKEELKKLYVTLPSSSTVAGIYARVDSDRGVWKAPANVSVQNIQGPSFKVTHDEQALLNIDATSGKSINAIRSFTGKGTLVWGARTLAGNDNEWRYVPVRRFYNFAEESIKKGSSWVVFEPNDANTWVRVKAMIENFLIQQWRAGALAGAKPEDAFFVKVGLGVTMTAIDILEGRMNIEIGMAVVRPAEFVILKFSHKLQES